jgi:hypothetical protein
MQIQALNKEKSSLEAQVRALLIEKDQWLESIAQSGKNHQGQLESYREENEKLKR